MYNQARNKIKDCNKCLKNNEIKLKSQKRLRNETHEVFTAKINKIAVKANDHKTIQTSDGVATYPYGYEL